MNSSAETIKWKEAWKSILFRISFGVTVLCLIAFALFFPTFFDFIEARNGPCLNDFVLNFIPCADVSWVIFFFLYSGIFLAIFALVTTPKLLILALQTYILVTLLRVLSITLLPLDPPNGYLALKQPFVQFFTNNGRLISKDLFFSGHVSTLCSALFCIRNPVLKWIITICAVLVAILVLVQRVHYTIDVVVAPVITYGCYLFVKRFISRL